MKSILCSMLFVLTPLVSQAMWGNIDLSKQLKKITYESSPAQRSSEVFTAPKKPVSVVETLITEVSHGETVYGGGTGGGYGGGYGYGNPTGPTMGGLTPEQAQAANPECRPEDRPLTPVQVADLRQKLREAVCPDVHDSELGEAAIKAFTPPAERSAPQSEPPPPKKDSFQQSVQKQESDLRSIHPQNETQHTAQGLGIDLTLQARDLDQSEGQIWLDMGKGVADIASGLNPITGMGRSTYEFFTGQDLFTGLPISSFERGMAFAGIVSLGTTKWVQTASKIGKVILKGIQRAPQLVRGAQNLEKTIQNGERIAETPPEPAFPSNQSQAPPVPDQAVYRFYRLESPTQRPHHAEMIEESEMLLGGSPYGSLTPEAQGYYGELPEGARGIQLETTIKPDSIAGQTDQLQGSMVRWVEGQSGVTSMTRGNRDLVSIPVKVIKNTQK